MIIGHVTVCDDCGAAYTAHTNECQWYGKPPPMWRALSEFSDEPTPVTRPVYESDSHIGDFEFDFSTLSRS